MDMRTRENNGRLREYLRAGIVVPLLTGLLTGFVWVYWGSEVDDVPLLSFTLLGVCVGSLYLGVRRMNKLNRWLKPGIVLPLLFGSLIIVGRALYWLGGVYNEPPGMVLGGLVLALVLLAIGLSNIRRLKKTTE
jgi:hypothetical protein